jgi:hypothetical protein
VHFSLGFSEFGGALLNNPNISLETGLHVCAEGEFWYSFRQCLRAKYYGEFKAIFETTVL